MNQEKNSSSIYDVVIGTIGLIASAVNVYKFGSEHETVNLVFALISLVAFSILLGLRIAKRVQR